MKKFIPFIVLMVLSNSSYAYRYALGVKASTLGVGPEVLLNINSLVDVRANINTFTYEKSIDAGVIDYDVKAKLFNAGLFIDLHPIATSLRASGGIVYNNNKFSLIAPPPSKNLYVNGNTYVPSQIGETKGTISFNKASFYLGFGYEPAFRSSGNISVSTEYGLLFQGVPKAKISSTSALSTPEMIRDLEKDAVKRANKKFIRVYPIFGISIKIFS